MVGVIHFSDEQLIIFYLPSTTRRHFYGIPKRFWCGKTLVIWASETKENPYRRFYRCEVTMQRKQESHLFKWEDEALLDETRMVDAKVMDLVKNLRELSKNTQDQLDCLRSEIIKRDADKITRVNESTHKMSEELVDVKREMRDEILGALSNKKNNLIPMLNIAVAAAVLGGMSMIYCMSV